MKALRISSQKLCLVVFLILISSACHRQPKIEPEVQLLDVFKEELDILKSYQDGAYEEYMVIENQRFQENQLRINKIIAEINNKYSGLDEKNKMNYQFQWRDEFQPVVSAIYAGTKELVVRATKTLTAQKMARIKELSLERKALEAKTKVVQLKPQFFEIPLANEESTHE